MYTSMNILIYQSGQGVGGARVCAFNHCSIVEWNRVAKWVNILQDTKVEGSNSASVSGKERMAQKVTSALLFNTAVF